MTMTDEDRIRLHRPMTAEAREKRRAQRRAEQIARLEMFMRHRRALKTHQEIADIAGESVSTVRSVLSSKRVTALGREDLLPELNALGKKLLSIYGHKKHENDNERRISTVRRRYDEMCELRLAGRTFLEISNATGYSVELCRTTFSKKFLEMIGEADKIETYQRISREQKGAHQHRSDSVRQAVLDGITPDDYVAAHPNRSEAYTRGAYKCEVSALYESDNAFRARVDGMIKDGDDVCKLVGMSEAKLRQIKRVNRGPKKRHCCGCGKQYRIDDLSVFRGRELCRTCLYDGDPDPPVDMRIMLSAMSNNQKG